MVEHRRVSRLPFTPYASYHRKYVNHLFEEFGDRISGDVLDIGSKTRERERYAQWAQVIERFTALDITTRGEFSLDVLGDGRALPFRENAFDTVIVSEVIEHVEPGTVGDLLAEAKRVLKPSGSILVTTPFVYPIHGDGDYSRWTPAAVAERLDAVGFEEIVAVKGGNYADVLLHVLWHPFCFDVTPRFGFGTRHLGWVFALVHYPVVLLSYLPWKLLAKQPPHTIGTDHWFVTTFVTARSSAAG